MEFQKIETKKIRTLLKNSEPYRIEKELLPNIYLFNDTEYWIFFYSFCKRMNDITIGIRLGLDRSQVYRRTLKIIKNNKTILLSFLEA